MYAHVSACTGWTWATIRREMDLPQLEAMTRYWRKYPPPPVQMMRIAAALGIKPETEETTAAQAPEALDDQAASLLQTFPTQPAQPYMSAEDYLRNRAKTE